MPANISSDANTLAFMFGASLSLLRVSSGLSYLTEPSLLELLLGDLRYIRQELRDLDQMLGKHGLLPEMSELKEVYNSLDALHQLLSGKVKKKPKPEFDD